MKRERIERLPNFIKRFGLKDGLRLGTTIPDAGTLTDLAPLAYRVPGFSEPVWLRPNRSDYSIFWQSFVCTQYDLGKFPQTEELERRAEEMCAAGEVPIIIDGGANIGLSLRSFAKDFPFAHVVCVEPDDDNFRVLEANARELKTPHTLVKAGIASRSGHCRVVSRDRGSAGFQTEYCDESNPEAIRTATISELVGMVPGGRPWIVKLDIEGAQQELFSGATDWVAETDLIILELDDWAFPWQGTSVAFFRALAPHRFDYLIDQELILAFRHRNGDHK